MTTNKDVFMLEKIKQLYAEKLVGSIDNSTYSQHIDNYIHKAAQAYNHSLDAEQYARLNIMGDHMTPEGKVKAMVKERIKALSKGDPDRFIYSWWPVTNGMGNPGLDCIGCVNGRMFAIETKAPGGKVTPRQNETIRLVTNARAPVFVVSNEDEMVAFEMWAEACFALTP